MTCNGCRVTRDAMTLSSVLETSEDVSSERDDAKFAFRQSMLPSSPCQHSYQNGDSSINQSISINEDDFLSQKTFTCFYLDCPRLQRIEAGVPTRLGFVLMG